MERHRAFLLRGKEHCSSPHYAFGERAAGFVAKRSVRVSLDSDMGGASPVPPRCILGNSSAGFAVTGRP